MSGELQQKSDRIAAKIRIVLERYAVITAQRDEALEQISAQEKAIAALKRRIAELESQAEYLKAAMTFAPTGEDTARARTMLAELVREIDTCIAELKD